MPGTKDVEMRIETSPSPGCLKHNHTTNIHWFLKPMADNIPEESMTSFHKLTQKKRIMIEPFPELFWHCEHNMTISHFGKKSFT